MPLSPPLPQHPNLYGSPNQASRAQQSRHQLVASSHSAASTPRSLSAAPTPAAQDTKDPLAAYVSTEPLDTADHDDHEPSLSAYPSIHEIHQEASRHQEYYYSAQDATGYSTTASRQRQPQQGNKWTPPNPFRKPLARNYDSYRSIAHPFETFSDNEHHDAARGGDDFLQRLAHRASGAVRNMYGHSTHNDSNGAPPGTSAAAAGNGGAGGRRNPFAKLASGHSHSNSVGGDLYRSLRWSSDRPPMTRQRKLMLLRSYAPDWVITIVLAGLLALINKVHGFRREFSLTDTAIQHTYATSERVPMWLLGLTVVIIPALLIAGVSLGVSRSVWDLHNGLLGFVLAHCLNVTITTIIKVCVGRPRPDLIDRCHPRPGSVNASPYGLATDAICTVGVDDSTLRDGFRSFPSGHASSAFAGLTFLTLYLAGKMHLFDRRGHAISAWLTLTPMLGAALIAVSRTMDYRHHATDVIAGALLGMLMAYSVYRLYYPPLSHPACHKPYSPRIPRERMAGERSSSSGEYDEEGGSELGDHRRTNAGRFQGDVEANTLGAPGAAGGSEDRMLNATRGVLHPTAVPGHGGKGSLEEDEYIPETVQRV